jgi:ABC-type cobalt transport system substrate-binding protein
MSMRLATALILALAAMSAHAQTAPNRIVSDHATTSQADVFSSQNTEVLPVWNNHSGKVEALLLLRPAQQANGSMLFGTGVGVNTGHGLLQANVSAEGGNGLALLCNSSTGLVTLGSLAGRCLVTSLDTPDPFGRPVSHPQSQSVRAEARFERPDSLFSLSVGQANLNMAGTDWFSPNSGLIPGMSILGGQLSQQDVTASGRMSLGDNGWVSIGGTLARAQLIPTAGQGGGGDAKRWNSTSVGVAVGRGKISGEVIGRVVDVPGQSNSLSSLGVGLSWRTPWQGKLTFGAEKSTGTSPLTPAAKSAQTDEGTVPYVQYHQDL